MSIPILCPEGHPLSESDVFGKKLGSYTEWECLVCRAQWKERQGSEFVEERAAVPGKTAASQEPWEMSQEEFYRTHSKPAPGYNSYAEGERLDSLPDDTELWVYHSTDQRTAQRFLEEGIDPAAKPLNLARIRYEQGEYAEFAPGRGVGKGLYVTSTPSDASGYGRVTLAIRVRKGDLEPSPEALSLGNKTVGHALAVNDAMVVKPVPKENIRTIGEPGRYPRPAHEQFVQDAVREGKIPSHPDYPEAGKTASKQPWQLTKEEFLANPPEGFEYVPGRPFDARRQGPGLTRVSDTFFEDPDEDSRRMTLNHEVGHDLMTDFNGDFRAVLAPFRKDGKSPEAPMDARTTFDNPFGMRDNPEEIVADTYAALFEGGDKWYSEDPKYANLVSKVIEVARRKRLPLPPILADKTASQSKTAKRIAPVYHGTPRLFDEFAPSEGQRTVWGLVPISVKSGVFFFTPDARTARNWAGNRAEQGEPQYVLTCEIAMENPVDMRTDAWIDEEVAARPLPLEGIPEERGVSTKTTETQPWTLLEALHEYTEGKLNEIDWRDMGIDINRMEVIDHNSLSLMLDNKEIVDTLRFLKYDGVIYNEGEDPEFGGVSYGVFSPSQVKILRRTKIAELGKATAHMRDILGLG